MSQRSFAFDPPRWRAPVQTNRRTAALVLGSLAWLALYGWLSWRLWHAGVQWANPANRALIAICLVGGLTLAVGWRLISPRWALRLHMWTASHRAMSLERIQALTPSQFEEYVAQRLFVRQGYKVHNTPDVKDGGIDILVEDGSGGVAVVQCKRYTGVVGESVVRDLYGTMMHAAASRAYLVTTGRISDAARRWAVDKPIELIDVRELVRLAQADPQPPQPDRRIRLLPDKNRF